MQNTLAVADTRAMISSNTYRLYDKYADIADDEGFTGGRSLTYGYPQVMRGTYEVSLTNIALA